MMCLPDVRHQSVNENLLATTEIHCLSPVIFLNAWTK